jgi:hypothetical protein
MGVRLDPATAGRNTLPALRTGTLSTGRLELTLQNVNGKYLHFRKLLGLRQDQIEIDEPQFQLGDYLGMQTEEIEQPNQLQLIIRARFEP